MKTEFSSDEFYALNNELFVKLSNIETENNAKMINELNYILLRWQEIYQMNLPDINILNQVFTNYIEVLDKAELSKIELFSKLITEITSIYYQNTTNYSKMFGNVFFTKWYEAVKRDNERNKEDSHNFNILRMFQIYETKHSQLLRLLLNPNSDHGQGDLFLTLFLDKIGIKEPSKGTWKVTAEEGRIDLLLKRNNPLSIVIVENKSNNAADQQNQLYRYWYNEIYKVIGEIELNFYEQNYDSFQIIYLSPKGKMYDNQTISKPKNSGTFYSSNLPDKIPMEIKRMTFNEDIFNWIGDCIGFSGSNHRIKEYLKQYQEVCYNL